MGAPMQLSLVTVALDPETGRFPEQPIAHLQGDVVSVVEHFFTHAGLPRLLLIVHWQAPPDPNRRVPAPQRRATGDDPRMELTADERPIFDRLRAWRTSRSTAEAVPPYVILTNRQLADLARARPTTLVGLREIPGLGEAKGAKYGEEILKVVAHGR